jgi:pimeloyl-ACP methyl ester carboxylesterase
VARLALLDTGVHGLAPGAAGEQEAAGRWRLVDLARQAGMRAMGTEWARGMVPENRWHEPLFEEILQMIERRTPELFAAQQRALLGRRDSAEVLAGVRVPTLILCGEEDRWSPPAQHVAMAALCPGARLVRVAHAGHMVTMEDPAAVSAALRDWARA